MSVSKNFHQVSVTLTQSFYASSASYSNTIGLLLWAWLSLNCRPLSGYLTKTRTSVASRVCPSKLNRTFFGVKWSRIAGQVDFLMTQLSVFFIAFTKGI